VIRAGTGYSASRFPDVSIFPILFVPDSVNHRLPSGPAVMSRGSLPSGRGNSPIMLPDVSISPILFVSKYSVNHRLPLGPAVIPPARLEIGNSETTPEVVTRPMLFPYPPDSVNHRFLSGPGVISEGSL